MGRIERARPQSRAKSGENAKAGQRQGCTGKNGLGRVELDEHGQSQVMSAEHFRVDRQARASKRLIAESGKGTVEDRQKPAMKTSVIAKNNRHCQKGAEVCRRRPAKTARDRQKDHRKPPKTTENRQRSPEKSAEDPQRPSKKDAEDC